MGTYFSQIFSINEEPLELRGNTEPESTSTKETMTFTFRQAKNGSYHGTFDEEKGNILLQLCKFVEKSAMQLESIPPQHTYFFDQDKIETVIKTLEGKSYQVTVLLNKK